MLTKLRAAVVALVISAGLAGVSAPAASAHHPDLATTQNMTYNYTVNWCQARWGVAGCGGVSYVSCGQYGDHSRACQWQAHFRYGECTFNVLSYVDHNYSTWKRAIWGFGQGC